MDAANDLLEKYKKHPFAKGLLPFRAALRSLDSPYPKVYAKQEGRQRWVICDKSTGNPAIFSHAAVFAQCDHIETGNYVPAGEEVPVGVETKGVQNRANTKCFYTYIFDSFADLSLYEGQWVLDDHMRGVKDFNPTNLPRRMYLSGEDARPRCSSGWDPERSKGRALLICMPGSSKRKDSKAFCVNPNRPRVWVKDGDDIVPISQRVPDTLQRGDIVGISFTITYYITATNWFPQFHPADIVVLKATDGDATDYSAPEIGLYDRHPPFFVAVDGEPDERQSDGEGGGAGTPRSADPGGPHGKGVEDGNMGPEVAGNLGGMNRQAGELEVGGGTNPGRSVGTFPSNMGELPERSDEVEDLGEGENGRGGGFEDFVDLGAEGVGKPTMQAATGKPGRLSRKWA